MSEEPDNNQQLWEIERKSSIPLKDGLCKVFMDHGIGKPLYMLVLILIFRLLLVADPHRISAVIVIGLPIRPGGKPLNRGGA